MRSRRATCALVLVLVLGCGGGQQSDTSPAPNRGDVTINVVNRSSAQVDVSSMFDATPASRLGTVRAGSEEEFTIYWRAGDLRMVVGYIGRRTATSNPIEDLRRGDRLQLVVPSTGAPELTKSTR